MNEEDLKEKKSYELTVLLDEENNEAVVSDLLTAHGAEVFYKAAPRSTPLAYLIKKRNSALFVFYHFTASPEIIDPLDKALKAQPFVLRHLIVTPPFEAKKAASMPAVEPAMPEPKPAPSALVTNEALEEALEKILQ